MLTLESLEVGELYRCKIRRGLFKINLITEKYYTSSHIMEIHPETPFVVLGIEYYSTKKHLKVLTIDGIVGHIIYESDIEKVTHQ
mgnify:FL=1